APISAVKEPRSLELTRVFFGSDGMTAINPVFPDTRLRAAGFGLYPRRFATSRTRWRVSGLRRPLSFSACETVVTETSASRATSLMLIRWSRAICQGYSGERSQRFRARWSVVDPMANGRRFDQVGRPRLAVACSDPFPFRSEERRVGNGWSARGESD